MRAENKDVVAEDYDESKKYKNVNKERLSN